MREDEPQWLEESVLLAIHAQQIERYGGMHGVRDENVLRSALARPIHHFAYLEGADLAVFASAYLVGLVRSQGFLDGNKRTGVASALVFLWVNDYAVHVAPQELYALTMRVATGRADDRIVAAYFRDRMRPR